MHGDMDQFWAHLTASMRLSALLQPVAVLRPRSRSMINICNFLHVISESTNWSLVTIPWDESSPASMTAAPLFYEDGTLEITYGTTASHIELIWRITRLTQATRYYEMHQISPPPGVQTALDRLTVAVESLRTVENIQRLPQDCDEHAQSLLKQHIETFALSIKVYFYSSLRTCDQERMDLCVQEISCKLNAIEQQKQSMGKHYAKTATIAWPGFIASCESRQDHRGLWRRWWSKMIGYGIGNIEALWSIVQESWRLKDAGSAITPAWLPVLKANRKFILAV